MTGQMTRSTNILFSTTRQWNPGDEFILKGIQNLLQELHINFNGLIFNRHPDNLQSYSKSNPLRKIDFDFRGKGLINSFIRLGSADNSFKSGMTANGINLVIVAGSPGWYGKYTSPLYDLVDRNKIPIAFIGIGSHHIDPQSMQSALSGLGFDDILTLGSTDYSKRYDDRTRSREVRRFSLTLPSTVFLDRGKTNIRSESYCPNLLNG